MTRLSEFNEAALSVIGAQVDRLRGISFESARALPAVAPEDIVVAGREVHLTIFRQADLPSLDGQVLVTVQVARYGLGGVVSYRADRGLVFSRDKAARDATETELQDSAAG